MGITGLQVAAKVTIDSAEAESGLKRVGDAAGSAGGGIKGFLANVASIAGAIGITQVAGSAFGFVKDQLFDSVKVAQDYQLAQAQLAQGLKSTHDASGETVKSLTDLSEAYSQQTTFSKAAIEQAEGVTLSFTNIGKNVFPQATMAAMDLATRMGTDLPSATLQIDKALGDPIKGITALTRVGVVFTDQQKAQIKAMQDSGNMAGAQGIILKELQKEFGGSAVAAGGTFAGALQIAQNQLEDTKEKIGTALLPVLGQLLKAVTPLIGSLTQGLAVVLPVIVTWITNLFSAGSKLSGWLPMIFNQVQSLGFSFMQGLQPAISLVTSALGDLSSGGISAQGVMNVFGMAISQIGPIVNMVGSAIAMSIQTAIPIVSSLMHIGMQLAPVLYTLGAFVISDVMPAFLGFAGMVQKNLLPIVLQIGTLISTVVVPIIKQLVTTFETDLWPTIDKVATEIGTQLLPPVRTLIQNFLTILGNILPVLNPLLQVLGWIVSNVVGPALGVAIHIVAGLATGLSAVIGVIAGVTGAFQGIAGAVGSAFGGLWSIVKSPINQMIDGINTIIRGLDSIHFTVPNWVPGFGGDGFGISIPTIPTLAAGTDDFQGGPAIIGEGGTPELVTGPTLANLAKGSQVIPVTQEAAGYLAGGLSPAYGAATASQGGQGVPVIIQIDGRTIAQIVLQNAPTVLRNATGARGF